MFTITWSKAQFKPGFELNDQAPILRFYPNPATTVITFDFQKPYDRGYSIQIYNFLGRKMYEQVNISDHTTINLTDFTRGVYIYQLLDRSGKIVESGKFQVSK
jgi:type IX secretion system substrate protein